MDINRLIQETSALLEPETKEDSGLCLNDNFKRWFGHSKIVDENGQPLIVYHGSAEDIEKFDLGYSGTTTGNNIEEVFYFTTDKETAISYSQEATVRRDEYKFYDEETGFDTYEEFEEHIREKVGENPKIHPCFLRIEKPYIYDYDYSDFDYKKHYTLLQVLKGNGNYNEDYIDWGFYDDLLNDLCEFDDDGELISEGIDYDGVIIKNVRDSISELCDGYIDEYIIWNPNQIKSIYNKGMWSEYNDNIYEEKE